MRLPIALIEYFDAHCSPRGHRHPIESTIACVIARLCGLRRGLEFNAPATTVDGVNYQGWRNSAAGNRLPEQLAEQTARLLYEQLGDLAEKHLELVRLSGGQL